MKRLALAGTIALALTVGVSACGSVDPDAAVVRGRAIKVRELEADVAAIQRFGVAEGGKAPLALPADGNGGVRSILAFEIVALLLTTTAEDPISVDAAAIAAADAELASQLGSDGWERTPADVRERIARAQAVRVAASAKAQADPAYGERLDALLAATPVKVNPRYGTWDAQTGQITPLPVEQTTR